MVEMTLIEQLEEEILEAIDHGIPFKYVHLSIDLYNEFQVEMRELYGHREDIEVRIFCGKIIFEDLLLPEKSVMFE